MTPLTIGLLLMTPLVWFILAICLWTQTEDLTHEMASWEPIENVLKDYYGYESTDDVPHGLRAVINDWRDTIVESEIQRAREEERTRWEAIYAWLMGASITDDFKERQDGEGAYWWRKELAERVRRIIEDKEI